MSDVRSLCGDLTEFSLPPEPTVFYLFNPFTTPVVEKLVRRLKASLAAHQREVYVGYYFPSARHAFEAGGLFEPYVRGVDYVVYRDAELKLLFRFRKG